MLSQRAKALESQYVWNYHENFIIRARRNKMLGLWVADKLGLSETDAEVLSNGLVESGVYARDDETMTEIVYTELLPLVKKKELTKYDIYCKIQEFGILAEEYIFDHALELLCPKPTREKSPM